MNQYLFCGQYLESKFVNHICQNKPEKIVRFCVRCSNKRILEVDDMSKGKTICNFCPECVEIPEIPEIEVLRKKVELLEKEIQLRDRKQAYFISTWDSVIQEMRRDFNA